MVGAVAGDDLVAAGDRPGQLDGVLVRLRAAKGEEDLVDVPGEQLGELLPQQRPRLVRHEGIGERQLVGLALDGLDDAPVAVPGIDAHQLAVEVDIALAVRGVEIDALGGINRDWIGGRLRHPVVQRVLAAEGDDLLAAQHTWPSARF